MGTGQGLCGTCGRTRYLTACGTLPSHWNIGLASCAGAGQSPAGTWETAERLVSDGLADAGLILASLPAAGLVEMAS